MNSTWRKETLQEIEIKEVKTWYSLFWRIESNRKVEK